MNEKKLILIQTALQLFYTHGINSVGINEILKQSGIAKKTLYNHFSSKDDLVLATLIYRNDIFNQWFKMTLDSESSGEKSILALFYGLDDWFNNKVPELSVFRGCFFINTAAEYSVVDSPIRQYCRSHKQEIRSLITNKIRLFIEAPEEISTLTDIIFMLKEGAIVSALVEGNKNAGKSCIPVVTRLLNIK
ncbi:TetR/AcrR family transcriptional regulator [Moritella sp. Urea-trap-13]|uniref:TetR/AcrR family transcriptional regulator n=1 Tax=Moritella sp. Urea-trap-13 TaxID=2058327 RepID=UPI000C33A62C|nr:TetR/AcrR family transcriptional regulator [Moritella sp. Urea-trap-13]PKH06830.1 TetR/AcrR family transcriptional regulator [Moritella sp. Urea-trap-13]